MTMKRYAFLPMLVFAVVFTLTGGQCPAETPAEIAAEIAPLISENTVCVVHVDIANLNPEQMTQHLKTLCNEIREAASFDGKLAKEMNDILPDDEMLDQSPGGWTEPLKMVRETCGVTEFYYLVTFPFQECLVVPIREGVKTEFFDERAFVKFKGFMVFPEPRHLRDDTNLWELIDRMFVKGFVPTERSELVAGLKLAGDRPVRAVAFLPAYAKTLVAQMMPQLPEPFDAIPTEGLLDGVQLVAAGFDPNTVQGELILKSKDQAAAESLRELLFSLPDTLTQLAKSQPELAEGCVPGVIFGNVLRRNADFLFPPPRDGAVTIRLPGENFAANMLALFQSIVAESKTGEMSWAYQHRTCMTNMKMIMLAMHNHHDAMRYLPQAYTIDAGGKPLHSWRVALLPYLEEYEMYKQIRLDEPWDSEWNRQFHDKCPEFYQCPTMGDEEKAAGLTSYSFVIGNDAYPKPGKRKFDFAMISDGTSNTIGIVERKTPVNWMCPDKELTQEEAFRGPVDPESGLGLRHEINGKKCLNVGVFDGSVHVIGDDIAPETWKAMLTRAGGERASY